VSIVRKKKPTTTPHIRTTIPAAHPTKRLRRIGVLTAADSEEFRSYLDHGSQQNGPVVTEAALERTPDASWLLTVYRPSTSE
jgi:hypothetical protein